MKVKMKTTDNTGCAWIILITLLTLFAAWMTHVIVCIKTASYLMLIAGGVVFPAGIIHGIGIWFNVW